jgi:TatA/E family protein of Tat protein translocase
MLVLGEIVGWELLLVVGIIALLFGSARIPQLARSLGQASSNTGSTTTPKPRRLNLRRVATRASAVRAALTVPSSVKQTKRRGDVCTRGCPSPRLSSRSPVSPLSGLLLAVLHGLR